MMTRLYSRRTRYLTMTVFILLLAPILSAASLEIKEAKWESGDHELKAKGKAPSRAAITLLDADSGIVLGRLTASKDGEWEWEKDRPNLVPCRLRAETEGYASEKQVKDAPGNCGGTPDTEEDERDEGADDRSGGDRDEDDEEGLDEHRHEESIDRHREDDSDDEEEEEGGDGNGGGGENPEPYSHVGLIRSYEGSRTCMPCHETQVRDVHASVHYQWQGATPDIAGQEEGVSGKLGQINDFCTYPDINWIGRMTTVNGRVVDGGCAKCHVGLGLKPVAEATVEQLENIDCLLCHSETYQRKLAGEPGSFYFTPDEEKMGMTAVAAAEQLHLPTSGTCLNCHTKSGGGNNFKRGDIEEAHRSATKDFDVHLAGKDADGAGLSCLDCHTSVNHRIAGRGSDLRPRETDTRLMCESCHDSRPHDDNRLDRHTARLNCTVCHIPSFAKVAPTDMRRDFSQPGELHETTGLYEPHMMKAAHVTPEYRFFNGRSLFYQFGEPVEPDGNGVVTLSEPEGTIHDPAAKIYAFKRHTAVQAVDFDERRLIPLKMGILFQTGNAEQAIINGAETIGWGYSGHEFVETERYMGLFHEVAPAEQALECENCHSDSGRMDFDALGYTPRNRVYGRALCASCHEDESDEWNDSERFKKIHEKHVDDKKINCIKCHTFPSAVRD